MLSSVGGLVDLVRRRRRVGFDDVIGIVAVEFPDGVGERFRRRIALPQHQTRRLFLGVRTCQQRNLGLLAGLIDCSQWLGQEIAIEPVQRGRAEEGWGRGVGLRGWTRQLCKRRLYRFRGG
jgi:hypothetical protein